MRTIAASALLVAVSAHVAAHLYDQPNPAHSQPASDSARTNPQPAAPAGSFGPRTVGFQPQTFNPPLNTRRYSSYSINGVNGAPVRWEDLEGGGLGFAPGVYSDYTVPGSDPPIVIPGNALPGNPSAIDPPLPPGVGGNWGN